MVGPCPRGSYADDPDCDWCQHHPPASPPSPPSAAPPGRQYLTDTRQLWPPWPFVAADRGVPRTVICVGWHCKARPVRQARLPTICGSISSENKTCRPLRSWGGLRFAVVQANFRAHRVPAGHLEIIRGGGGVARVTNPVKIENQVCHPGGPRRRTSAASPQGRDRPQRARRGCWTVCGGASTTWCAAADGPLGGWQGGKRNTLK